MNYIFPTAWILGVAIAIDEMTMGFQGTQEKKLKNWYIQEYTTGTTFEPKIQKKPVTKMNTDNGVFSTAKYSTIR